MKPFDLEAAKRGEPIITRDGRKATFIAHVPEATESQRVVVLIDTYVQSLRESGTYYGPSVHKYIDLFMAPKKRKVEGWVNVYPSRGFIGYATEEEAERYGGPDRIGGRAHFITFEIEE